MKNSGSPELRRLWADGGAGSTGTGTLRHRLVALPLGQLPREEAADRPFLPTAPRSTSHQGPWRRRQCVRHPRSMTNDDALPTAAEIFGEDPAADELTAAPFGPPAGPRPWFLGDAPAPEEEPSDAAGRSAMAAEAARLPFLRVVRHLLEFVGEGCRTTKLGALYAVDRRQIEESCREDSDGWSWHPYGTDSRVQQAWNMLTQQDWLVRQDGWVRPTGKPLLKEGDGAATEEGLDGARQLLVAVLEDVPTGYSFFPPVGCDEDLLDALAVASGPSGLVLPDHPRDGRLIHCYESVDFLTGLLHHPYVRDVPVDRASGHVEDSAIGQLARTAEGIEHLAGWGVVTCVSGDDARGQEEYWYQEGASERKVARTYRAPALMRGAITLVRKSRPF